MLSLEEIRRTDVPQGSQTIAATFIQLDSKGLSTPTKPKDFKSLFLILLRDLFY